MASEFQSICDDLGHATLTVEDARALIQPAWFLAQQALKEPAVALVDVVKQQLTIAVDALELNLAIVADKLPTATVDFYQFKDICHLSQMVWIITGALAGTSNAIATSRDLLAAASARVKTRMERDEVGPVSAGTILLWTSAIGFGIYLVRRFKRKHTEK